MAFGVDSPVGEHRGLDDGLQLARPADDVVCQVRVEGLVLERSCRAEPRGPLVVERLEGHGEEALVPGVPLVRLGLGEGAAGGLQQRDEVLRVGDQRHRRLLQLHRGPGRGDDMRVEELGRRELQLAVVVVRVPVPLWRREDAQLVEVQRAVQLGLFAVADDHDVAAVVGILE